eukprot:TRINITY_DN5985_c1_g3_i1.p1 TRINITY_DN5985_c1_g3~~TRINITY_DN5985_c1_g3_i1.p1  ORF type:complete len:629 (+),score=125.99 TRINITY_DN5985_c1_g3_i1:185-2071(+)
MSGDGGILTSHDPPPHPPPPADPFEHSEGYSAAVAAIADWLTRKRRPLGTATGDSAEDDVTQRRAKDGTKFDSQSSDELIFEETIEKPVTSADVYSDDGLQRMAMIDAELARLRPLRIASHKECKRLTLELKYAKAVEAREYARLTKRQLEMNEKLVKVTIRLQRCFREAKLRRKMLQSMSRQQAKMANWASSLPKQLTNHLHSMRISTHNLRYRPEDVEEATVQLQAWWRCLLARRAASVLMLSRWFKILHGKLEKAVMLLQARFRCRMQRRKFRVVLGKMMMETKYTQLRQMEQDHAQIVKIQRKIRVKLGRRKVEAARQARRNLLDSETLAQEDAQDLVAGFGAPPPSITMSIVDSWSTVSDTAFRAIKGLPYSQHLSNLEDAGAMAFHHVASEVPRRHRVGGPSVQEMLSTSPPGTEDNDHDDAAANDGWDVENEGVWDVYPSGSSPGFWARLPADALPRDSWAPYRPRTKGGSKAGTPRKRPCVSGAKPLPLHHGRAPPPVVARLLESAPSGDESRRRRQLHNPPWKSTLRHHQPASTGLSDEKWSCCETVDWPPEMKDWEEHPLLDGTSDVLKMPPPPLPAQDSSPQQSRPKTGGPAEKSSKQAGRSQRGPQASRARPGGVR